MFLDNGTWMEMEQIQSETAATWLYGLATELGYKCVFMLLLD